MSNSEQHISNNFPIQVKDKAIDTTTRPELLYSTKISDQQKNHHQPTEKSKSFSEDYPSPLGALIGKPPSQHIEQSPSRLDNSNLEKNNLPNKSAEGVVEESLDVQNILVSHLTSNVGDIRDRRKSTKRCAPRIFLK